MSWRKVKLKKFLKQYRIEHFVQNEIEYKQVTISKYDGVIFRGTKMGREIGRKRQFQIDLKKYPNTLIFVRQGVQEGSIGIATAEVDGCIATENMPMFSVEGINLEYLKLLLKSPYFYDELNKIQTTGSAQKSIHEREILEIEIPFPEIEEQKKIVSELSKKKEISLEISTELTHQLNLLKKLRQQLLQDAVQGKLSSAMITDELPDEHDLKQKHGNVWNMTGKELLAHIKSEKATLRQAQGSNKKEKELPPIKPTEIPFEIPENWVWCRLGEICNYGSSPKAEPKDINEDTWVLDLEDIEKETSNLVSKFRFLERNSLSTKSVFKKGDVLYSKLRPYLDKVIVADEDGVCTTEILPLKLFGNLNPYFLKYTLKRKDFLNYVNSVTKGMKMPRLGTNDGQVALIPLPPLCEQYLIVQKLDEIMQTCEAIENSIKESLSLNEKLLQQVLREAMSGE